ncbi:hypothetical protein, partial [Treponema berlinense]|uniref:hypothetical protein n=1 Tax=Treponema berlinense TaxID=225004 RepID=UPI001F236EB2
FGALLNISGAPRVNCCCSNLNLMVLFTRNNQRSMMDLWLFSGMKLRTKFDTIRKTTRNVILNTS